MSAGNWVRTAVMVLVALTVQQTVLVHLMVGRVHPEVMFLVAVAAGYAAGPGRGAVIGFSSGIVADLFVPTTFGMSALVGAVLAYCVGVAEALADGGEIRQVAALLAVPAVRLARWAVVARTATARPSAGSRSW